jgi:hypothetical protein
VNDGAGRPIPWRAVAGVAACLAMGWFAFVRSTNVPLLGLVDLGFHELGHLVTYWLPDVVTAMMGSIMQVVVPLGIATYFAVVVHDTVASGLCLAWAGTSAQNASLYIADAPYQRLQLIGGTHDWAFVLGPAHFNALAAAHTIAAVVDGVAFVLLLAGITACSWSAVKARRAASALEREPWTGPRLEPSQTEMWR